MSLALGDLPEHWGAAKLSLVAKLGTGHTPSRSEATYWGSDRTIPWLTTGDIERFRDGQLTEITETKESISELGLQHSSAVLHPPGTVALSRTASVGFPVIMGRAMATSQDFFTWTCSSALQPRFLLAYLRAMQSDLVGRLAMGSTHKTIYMSDIRGLRVPLPPLQDQRAIADFVEAELPRINHGIVLRRRLLALLPARTQSIMHGLLVRLPRNARLGYAVRWVSGGTPSRNDPRHWNGEVPWASTKDLSEDSLADTIEHITEDAAQDHSAIAPEGSLLVATRGMALAKRLPLAVTRTRMAFNQDLKALLPGPGLSADYLRLVLRGFEQEILGAVVEAAHGTRRLETKDLKAFTFPLPPRPEQQAVLDEVSHVETENRGLAELVKQQMALHEERRDALLTAAVTGQLDPTAYDASPVPT